MEGINQLDVTMSEVESIIHGCTVAVNAIITRSGSKTGLLTTEGFRDVMDFGRAWRPVSGQFDVRWTRSFADNANPIIPRYLRRAIKERIDYSGEVCIPLDEEQAVKEIEILKKCNVESIAICLLHSYINNQHEVRLKQLVNEVYPEVICRTSTEVYPGFKEFMRFSTTTLDAYVWKPMNRYLSEIEKSLKESGFARDLLVMQSNGGVASVSVAKEKPVATVQSGPVGGVMAALYLGSLLGVPNAIVMDIGGTSCDVAVITDNKSTVTTELEVEDDLIVALPSVEVKSIGAGGGSIAWIDRAGALRVGPQSAGAVPGPACYDRGGNQPTVADAHVVKGTLLPEYFLGGKMKLKPELSNKVIGALARRLDFTTPQCGKGICDIVYSNMAEAAKEISIYRGVDTRDHVLIAYGSAGPMFASQVLKDLDVKEAIIPPFPGEMCAFGLLTTDLIVDKGEAHLELLSSVSPDKLNAMYQGLEKKVIETFKRQNISLDNLIIYRSFDGRYVGQTWDTPSVPVPSGSIQDKTISKMIQNFHETHFKTWGYKMPHFQVRLITPWVRGAAVTKKPEMKKIKKGGINPKNALIKKTKVYMGETNGSDFIPVYDRGKLLAGNEVKGPSIIQQPTSTTILLSGDIACVDEYGNLRIGWM
jgi:N-methylhydantoinase A